MLAADQACYTLICVPNDLEAPNEMQLRNDLEKGDSKTKIAALKKVILYIMNGEKLPSLLMTIIRFVMPTTDHILKKLLLVFWEVVPKFGQDGKLLHEFILVCDAYRKDLVHPNEYVRGSTLRFLCKLKEPELLEPLMPAIRDCLKYRHAYVRRNAVLAIYTIYRNFEALIPDAPELMAQFMESEPDAACKRNAFLMLLHVDQERALNYLATVIDQVASFGDILQLVIAQLIFKVCSANPSERSRFIRCVYTLLNAPASAVRYEAAGTLVTLSAAPTAIKAAASCYIDLIIKEADNNVKLIVLDRLVALKDLPVHRKVLQDLVMDILRVLTSSTLEVRRKTLDLALELMTPKLVEEVVSVLKKEAVKTNTGSTAGEQEDAARYRQLLVRALHQCAIRYPNVASSTIPLLCEMLTDSKEEAASDVLLFLREAVHKFEQLRAPVIGRLLDSLSALKSPKVFRGAAWVLGEYCSNEEQIQNTITILRQLLGDLPIVESERKKLIAETASDTGAGTSAASEALISGASVAPAIGPRITELGTYTTQSALTAVNKDSSSSASSSAPKRSAPSGPPLRRYLMDAEHTLSSTVAQAVTKLALRYTLLQPDPKKHNSLVAECLFIISSILHLGKSEFCSKKMPEEECDRHALCLKVLSERSTLAVDVFNRLCRESLQHMYISNSEDEKASNLIKKQTAMLGGEQARPEVDGQQQVEHVDQPVSFSQLFSKADAELGEQLVLGRFSDVLSAAPGMLNAAIAPAGDAASSQATPFGGIGALEASGAGRASTDFLSSSKLTKITQLTGFSDPVYAEALVSVQQFDIVLDVLIVNRTDDTLQSLTLELATLGDLRLVERPAPIALAPRDVATIKASVKVASTDNGFIFGNIVYDLRGGASDRVCVTLSDVHIDIMDYLVPGACTEAEFRSMWSEFEWENKITINSNFGDLAELLRHLERATNMRCITPPKALVGDCGFMAASLYARSIFGEDALAHLSIEKWQALGPEAPITGHIRIRAKSQGMALNLGEKVRACQKRPVKASANPAPSV